MAHWLLKSEPSKYSWDQLVKDRPREDRFKDGQARSQLGLGNLYQIICKRELAQKSYQQAIEIWDALHKADPKTVAEVARVAKDKLIAAYNIVPYPKRLPSLANGKTIYNENCAQCHGATGKGDGSGRESMNPKRPPPADFTDPARIGVWGWSYGGYLTLMLMFKAPEVFSAGVAGAPVTDWRLYDTHYTERYLQRPQHNSAGYEASSALAYAKDLKGKLLVMHGMADDNVLFLHSTKLFRKLQDLGKPFDVMVYPGAKHGLVRQHDGRHAYATIKRFFDENLRP